MKRNSISKPASIYLGIGLLLVTLTPFIGRYFLLPDLVKGLATGMGLTLEVIALAKIKQSKKAFECLPSGD